MIAKAAVNKSIYDLEIFEAVEIGPSIIVIRVPGGWVMESSASRGFGAKHPSIVFIPYSEEFMKPEERRVP